MNDSIILATKTNNTGTPSTLVGGAADLSHPGRRSITRIDFSTSGHQLAEARLVPHDRCTQNTRPAMSPPHAVLLG